MDDELPSPRKRKIDPKIGPAVATVAVRTRDYGPDHPATLAARAQLAEAKLAAHIRKVVDGAPPLTDAQRDRLALLLRPGAGGVRAAT